jgi:protein-S-isoprenylcysteine O-methyltransferase Ste14
VRTLRPARPASPWWNVAKTLMQTFVFWSVFLGLLPWLLVRLEAVLGVPRFTVPGQVPAAVALFALCGSLGLTSGATMAWHGHGTPLPLDAPRRLVVRGPYARLRNPMAVAGLGQGAAVGLGLGSWTVLVYVVVGGLLWDRFVRPVEERDLEATFGDDFRAYRDAVRCWWPRLTPWRGAR